MITKESLQEAITECQGKRNPTSDTCLKLAAYYIVKDHMFDSNNKKERQAVSNYSLPSYSYAQSPKEGGFSSTELRGREGSEFLERASRMDVDDVFSVMDELMSTLSIINPRLYNGVMRALAE